MLTTSRGPKPPSSRLRRIYAVGWSCLAVAGWALYATARRDRPTFLAEALMFSVGAIISTVRAARRTADESAY